MRLYENGYYRETGTDQSIVGTGASNTTTSTTSGRRSGGEERLVTRTQKQLSRRRLPSQRRVERRGGSLGVWNRFARGRAGGWF